MPYREDGTFYMPTPAELIRRDGLTQDEIQDAIRKDEIGFIVVGDQLVPANARVQPYFDAILWSLRPKPLSSD